LSDRDDRAAEARESPRQQRKVVALTAAVEIYKVATHLERCKTTARKRAFQQFRSERPDVQSDVLVERVNVPRSPAAEEPEAILQVGDVWRRYQ